MFGKATITLGIGPHSSCISISTVIGFVYYRNLLFTEMYILYFMYILYVVTNLALWLQQINKLYLLT